MRPSHRIAASPLGRSVFALSFLLAVALAGCSTVGPDYAGPPASSTLRSQPAGAPFAAAQADPQVLAGDTDLPARWWRLYQTPALDSLVQQALSANADLRQAVANLARTEALLAEATAAGAPSLTASGGISYGLASAAAAGVAGTLPAAGSYNAGMGLSYTFDAVGQLRRTLEAAQADVEASAAARDLAHVTVAAETTRAYSDICTSGYQLHNAERSVALQEQAVQLTDKLLQAGRGTDLDRTRARAQLAQLQAALPPLLAARHTALYRLATLVGQVPQSADQSLPQAVRECDAPLPLARRLPVGDGAALLRRRPDVRQAERALAAASARIGVAIAGLYPTVTLGASLGSNGPSGRLGDAGTWHGSIGPLISWNLPNTGAARARIAQAQAGSDAALAHFDATVLGALRETETALTLYARELDRNDHLRDARQDSVRAGDQARALYRAGRADYLSVLDADRTAATAESALAASDALIANEQINVFLALGGGWES